MAFFGVSHVFISLTLSDSLKNWFKKGWYPFFAQESPWRCAPRTKLWNLLGHGGSWVLPNLSFGSTRHRAPQGFINHLLKQLMEVYMGIWHTHLYGKRTIVYCDWNKYGTHHILLYMYKYVLLIHVHAHTRHVQTMRRNGNRQLSSYKENMLGRWTSGIDCLHEDWTTR